MRTIQYLSPTSLKLFYENQEQFYLQYLTDNRPPRMPQTPAMAVGSSFDAYVKSFLHENIFGKGNDPRFDLTALFEAQVEHQNRSVCFSIGKELFEIYKKCGALSDLMIELAGSVIDPRFELDVKGVINGYREGETREFAEVTLLGKPDVFFINKEGARVILDWKVNGYFSKSPISPMKGYVNIFEGGVKKGAHKDAFVQMWNGIKINVGSYMETLNDDWAQQLCIYAWLCGEDVGTECINAIDQVTCKPEVRVSQHRLRSSKGFQRRVFERAVNAWEIIHSDHFFRDLSKEDSKARIAVLDKMTEPVASEDEWYERVCR